MSSIPIFSVQPALTYEQALNRAADLFGIEPEYLDTWGRKHQTPPEVQRAILEALGVRTDNKESLDKAVEEHKWREWSRLVPPVMVIGELAGPWELPLNIPSALAGKTLSLEILLENGEVRPSQISLEDVAETGVLEIRGVAFCRKPAPIPRDLPLGYHEVTVSLPQEDGGVKVGKMRLIVCPERAYVPRVIRDGGRTAGLAISLYGLRSERNWGCGDFTDLESLVDWLADEVGAAFVGLNPLHDTPNRAPFNISPYLPSSTFYRNSIYLDVMRIEDFRNCARARRLFARPEVQSELEALRAAEFVDYEKVHGWKMRGLKLAFLQFLRDSRKDVARRREFDEFVVREGELLERYAVYCALNEWIHRRRPNVWVWPDWPEEYRHPDSGAVRAFARKHRRRVDFYKYVQWQIQVQLAAVQERARARGLSIGLYHDLALANDRCGADLWAYREYYVSGCRVGAPPDTFSPKGQDWSFPPPNSARHREAGYQLFAESIRKNCRDGGALRIDHVMRFFHLYWIPEGMEPTRGAYVRDAHDDLLHILALESVRQQVAIVGEDLGTVAPGIRAALDRFGIFGYKVLYFEKKPNEEFRLPHEYPNEALVTSTTHDLPTLAGFWLARDVTIRRDAGLLPDELSYHQQLAERAREKQRLLDALFKAGFLPEWFPRSANHVPELTGELLNAIIGMLASTSSRLLALNQEDLTRETEQQNLPASTWQYPNWQRKMKYTLEDLRTPKGRDLTGAVRYWLERSGRLNR